MSRKIHVLPVALTLKIAAGEVIERPASILKELLENALDAGATVIRIDLQKGGCAGIRIEDNGSGISREEAPLAFERFATSKIDDFEELYGVATFGFRGEALPSIAAIARVEMITKTEGSLSGTRIVAEAGQILEISETGCPVGTTIHVTRLFDNVPVRKKFLKAEAAEQGYCLDVIHCTALAVGQVRMDVTAGSRSLFSLPASLRESERAALVLGREARENLLPIAGSGSDGLHLRGLVSRPEWSRSSARHLYCFVNHRHVKDPLINHAVMTAYRNVLEARRSPVAILHLEVPPETVDVNVHPRKMEVRFQNPRSIYGLVVESIIHTLSAISPSTAAQKVPAASIPAAAYQSRVEEALRRYHLHTGQAKLTFKEPAPAAGVKPFPVQPPGPAGRQTGGDTLFAPMQEKFSFSELTFLGQTAGAYLVFAQPDGLVLIDQHAAHERILFEKLRHDTSSASRIAQQLLMPEVITLAAPEFAVILDYLDLLRGLGMDVEPFGENTLIVKALPALLPDLDARGLMSDIVDDGEGMEHSPHLQEKRDRLLALLACRGAVKSNHDLSAAEVAALCRDLDKTEFASTCPHGRPTHVPISRKDLERMFKRR